MEAAKETLLRISISEQGTVREILRSSGNIDSDEFDDLIGSKPESILQPPSPTQRFSIRTFRYGGNDFTAAVRKDSENSLLVYFLDPAECLGNPAVPFIRLIPERELPLVSPGFVCLLGYTPWELSSSELPSSFTDSHKGDGGRITLIDKNGKGHRLVYSCVPHHLGGTDYTFVPEPDELAFPVKELERLAGMEIEEPADLLSFLADALQLETSVLLCRSTLGHVPVASLNVDIDSEHFETSELFQPETLQFPVWINLEEDCAPAGLDGQCLVYPAGNLVLVTPWRGDADSLQRRADALMPAVSMKYEKYRATHGEHRLQNLLSELDLILAREPDAGAIQKALDTASAGFAATVLAIYGPEESASPIVTSRTDRETRELLVSDRPFEECFSDTHVVVLGEGHTLLAAWSDNREVPYRVVDSLGRKLSRFNISRLVMEEAEEPDFNQLQAVFMKDTRVLWQGRSLGLSHCYQFYGNSRQCIDCPVLHLGASGNRSARLENHQGFVEEIYPSGGGFLVTWTRAPAQERRETGSREIFPGGEAEYTPDGGITDWTGWFQEATGAGLEKIRGQNAARILNRIGSPPILSQYRSALAGVFIPEPVEFIWKGMKCFSRMRKARDSENILHTVLDSNRAGISDATTLGPGTITSSRETRSLAEFLSTACRREGWEFDISGATSEEGAPVWFSRRATTDLLTSLLHMLAPMCPDRWAGLETGWLDNTPEAGPFSFLPGQYHVLQFKLQGMGLDERSSILKKLSVLFRGFGGWLTGAPERDVLQVGLPAAKKNYRETDAVIYSPLQSFTELCREATADMKSRKFTFVESAGELATQQQTAGALICRLDQSSIHYSTALAARIPRQPILVASGLSSGIPSITARVKHLQLPTDERTLFSEIRKLLRR